MFFSLNKFTNLFFNSMIFLIFLLSFLAMINGFTVKSLLLDETFFARNIAAFPEGYYYHSAPSAPLFYLFSYILVSIFGQSEWVYRIIPLVSAVAGFLLFIRFLLNNFSKFIVLNTLFLLATSVPFIQFASNAHPYATDFLCSTILLILTHQYIKNPTISRWIILLIVSIVSICFSFPALFIFTSFCILILIHDITSKEWQELRNKLLTLIPSGLIIFFLLFFFIMKVSQDRQDLSYWEPFFPPSFIPWYFFKWVYFSTNHLLAYLFWNEQSGLIGIFLILLGTSWTISKKKYDLMILCWSPILFSILASSLQKWPYGPIRAMLFSLPFFLVLFASGLEFIWKSIKPTWSKVITVIAFLAILIPQSWTFKKGFEQIKDSEEAIRTLSKTIKPKIMEEDHFIIYYAAAVQFQFYFPEYSDQAIVQSWADAGDSTRLVDFVDSTLFKKKGRFWIIFSHIQGKEDEWMLNAAKKQSQLLESHAFPGCRAFLLDNQENIQSDETVVETINE